MTSWDLIPSLTFITHTFDDVETSRKQPINDASILVEELNEA